MMTQKDFDKLREIMDNVETDLEYEKCVGMLYDRGYVIDKTTTEDEMWDRMRRANETIDECMTKLCHTPKNKSVFDK